MIDFTDQEFNQLVFVLSSAEFKNGVTWNMINPLIVALQRGQLSQGSQTQQALPRAARLRDGNKGVEVS